MKEKLEIKYSSVVYNLFPYNSFERNKCIIRKNELPKDYQNIEKINEKFKNDLILFIPRSDILCCIYKDCEKYCYTSIEHSFEIFCKNDKLEIIAECQKNTKVYDVIKLYRLITNNHIFIYTTNVKTNNESSVMPDAIVNDYILPSIFFCNSVSKPHDDIIEKRLKIPIDFELYIKTINEDKFLNIAHTFYDNSFFQHNLNTKFLLLFASLETFFNTGPSDIRYKISLYTSTLISDNDIDRKKVFENINKLYSLRSNFVHSTNKGDKNKHKEITPEDEFELREYVRLVILRYIGWSHKTKNNSQKAFVQYINDIIFSGKNTITFENYN